MIQLNAIIMHVDTWQLYKQASIFYRTLNRFIETGSKGLGKGANHRYIAKQSNRSAKQFKQGAEGGGRRGTTRGVSSGRRQLVAVAVDHRHFHIGRRAELCHPSHPGSHTDTHMATNNKHPTCLYNSDSSSLQATNYLFTLLYHCIDWLQKGSHIFVTCRSG